jgi:hypothetical protein
MIEIVYIYNLGLYKLYTYVLKLYRLDRWQILTALCAQAKTNEIF